MSKASVRPLEKMLTDADLITIFQLDETTGRRTLSYLRSTHQLAYRTVARKVRYYPADVQAYLDQSRGNGGRG